MPSWIGSSRTLLTGIPPSASDKKSFGFLFTFLFLIRHHQISFLLQCAHLIVSPNLVLLRHLYVGLFLWVSERGPLGSNRLHDFVSFQFRELSFHHLWHLNTEPNVSWHWRFQPGFNVHFVSFGVSFLLLRLTISFGVHFLIFWRWCFYLLFHKVFGYFFCNNGRGSLKLLLERGGIILLNWGGLILLDWGSMVGLLLWHLLHDWDQLFELCLHLHDTLLHLNHRLNNCIQLGVLLGLLERYFFYLFWLLNWSCFLHLGDWLLH